MIQQRAVVYDELGGPEVLHLTEAPVPSPAAGRALLAVRAVGINPYDAKVRSGLAPRDSPFPRGIGGDVAGVVVEIGPDALYADGTPVAVGDVVFGWGLNTLRERLVVRTSSVAPVPAGLDLAVAGSLATPGLTALSCLDAVPLTTDDTVLVSSGSGSVGFLIAQLAARAGARVIGTTGAASEQRLRDANITPIRYGAGLAERLRDATDGAVITAAFDSVGAETIEAALELGAAPERICTIAGDDLVARFGVTGPSSAPRSTAALSDLGLLIAAGEISFPVAATYALDDAAAAFAHLETGHPGGKIVITPA